MTGGGERAAEQGDDSCQAGEGDAAPAPPNKGHLQKEPPARLAGMLTDSGPNLELSSQLLTQPGDSLSPSAVGGARLPIPGALRAPLSQAGSGTFPTFRLWGVTKHRVYFPLQQGLQHCCGQVLESVPCFCRKGRMAILSCFKALGAYKQCASPKCCYLPQCCRPRLWQSRKNQVFWAVPYTIYFCQLWARDAAWEIETGDKPGVGCERSKTLQKEQSSLVTALLIW